VPRDVVCNNGDGVEQVKDFVAYDTREVPTARIMSITTSHRILGKSTTCSTQPPALYTAMVALSYLPFTWAALQLVNKLIAGGRCHRKRTASVAELSQNTRHHTVATNYACRKRCPISPSLARRPVREALDG
jgi:hypothetical protein